MQELFEFLVCKGAHCDVWQTTPDVDGNDVTVWCSESLSTTINLNGMIVDIIATPFELTGGMNSTALSSVRILMHNSNILTTLSVYNCTDSADWDILDHVVVNTLNMNRVQGLINKPCVQPGDTTVGAMIKSASGTLSACGWKPDT
jgi:hypothetical protein